MFLPPSDRTIADILRRLNELEGWRVRHQPHAVGGAVSLSEGTFTPAWEGTTTPGAYTYANQTGFYTLLDNLMIFWGHMRLSSIDSNPVGDMWIVTDLPAPDTFPDSSFFWPGAFTFQRISFFNMLPNTVQMTLVGWDNSGNLAMFPEQVFDDATFSLVGAATFIAAAGQAQVSFSGIYRVAP